MSVDIFVYYFKDGKPELMPMACILDIFIPYITESSDGSHDLCYDDLNGSYLYFGSKDENDNVGGFRINRPCADERFWECIYKSLLLGNGVLVCPGMKSLLAARSEAENHLPRELKESFDGVRVVPTYRDFWEALKEW